MDLTKRAYCDRILRVNLTTGDIEVTPPRPVDPLEEELNRRMRSKESRRGRK